MTLFYPDVSNNNWSGDQDAIDFLEQLIPQGFAGVVHKVSEGDYYEDPYWPVVLQWCQQNNMVCLGYHYVTEDDPASQAQTWLGNVTLRFGRQCKHVSRPRRANLASVEIAMLAG